MGNLKKGIKNLFGRKQRKAARAQAQLDDQLQDPLAWQDNAAYADPLAAARVNPLFDAGPRIIGDDDVASAASVGGGSLNEVTRLQMRNPVGGSTTGFFKADSEAAQTADVAGNYGIGHRDGDTHMSTRAVMSSRLGQALGTNVIAEEHYARINGQEGSVSAGVSGIAASRNDYDKPAPDFVDDAWMEARPNLSWKYQKRDGAYFEMTSNSMADVDLRNATTQREMAELQLMDSLTGQADRHEGNLFIDPETGSVRGIDNDLAFGEKQTGSGINAGFLPELIDADMGERILTMSNDEFLEVLAARNGDFGELGPVEKDQALNRFKIIKAHISALHAEDGLVNEWNDDTFDRAIGSEGNNYLKRHHEGLTEARAGTSPVLKTYR